MPSAFVFALALSWLGLFGAARFGQACFARWHILSIKVLLRFASSHHRSGRPRTEFPMHTATATTARDDLQPIIVRAVIGAAATSLLVVLVVLALTQLTLGLALVVISGSLVSLGLVIYCFLLDRAAATETLSVARIDPAATSEIRLPSPPATAPEVEQETELAANLLRESALDETLLEATSVDENALEEESAELPDGATLRLTRYERPGEGSSLVAAVRIVPEQGETTHVLHLLFQPPFEASPTVEAEVAEGDAELSTTLVEPYGCRLEVKLAPGTSGPVVLQLVAYLESPSL